jgi:hypothetical protein
MPKEFPYSSRLTRTWGALRRCRVESVVDWGESMSRGREVETDGPTWFRSLGSGWSTVLITGLAATLSQYSAAKMNGLLIVGPRSWSTGGLVAVLAGLWMWRQVPSWEGFKRAVWIPVVLVSVMGFIAVDLQSTALSAQGSGTTAVPPLATAMAQAPATAAAPAPEPARPIYSYSMTISYLQSVYPNTGARYVCGFMSNDVYSYDAYRSKSDNAPGILSQDAYLDFMIGYCGNPAGTGSG